MPAASIPVRPAPHGAGPAGSKPHPHRWRVALVDDHPMMRAGLSLLLNSTPDLEVCCEAGSLAEARCLISRGKPDLVLMDLDLPDGSGLELLEQFNRSHPDVPVLVVTMYGEGMYAERCRKAGARGYLMKEAGGARMLETIRTVLSEGPTGPRDAGKTARPKEDRSERQPSPLELLTGREFEVFRLIGEGRDTRDIAARLSLSPKTVDVHRANIKEKLGIQSLPELIRFAVCWREGQRDLIK